MADRQLEMFQKDLLSVAGASDSYKVSQDQVGAVVNGAATITDAMYSTNVSTAFDVILLKLAKKTMNTSVAAFNSFLKYQDPTSNNRVSVQLDIDQDKEEDHRRRGGMEDETAVSYSSSWSFATSFLYSLSLITTVGM